MKKIRSIEVKSSTFYKDFKILFSDRLNCIMGGRGTGKTTLLYFLKSALDTNVEKSEGLLRNLRSNLGNGIVVVEIEGDDGISYNITKTLYDYPQPYRLPGNEFVTIESILNEVECDFYEAGRIEQIGRNSKDRLDLIDKKIKNEIQEQQIAIKSLQIDLDANAQDIKSFNKRLAQIDEVLSQYENIEAEFQFQKEQQPSGINEDEKRIFEAADISEKVRREERRHLQKSVDFIKSFQYKLAETSQEIVDFIRTDHRNSLKTENTEIVNDAQFLILNVLRDAYEKTQDIIFSTDVFYRDVESILDKLRSKHDTQQAEFVLLKQKFEINKEYINKYNILSRKVVEKVHLLNDKEELVIRRLRLKTQRNSMVAKLNELKQEIFSRRLNAIKELNSSFNGDVYITLDFGGIKEEYHEKLRSSLKGSGLQYNQFISRIVESFTPDKLAEIVHKRDVTSFLTITKIDLVRSQLIIDNLFESQAIYDLESLYCNDLPEFKLRIADDSNDQESNYRKTDELSMGQRCTTVLPIIFAVSTNPLIIDQPEDNLDNKYITQSIHKIIRQQKEKRQLIFITHNPNIPVLSDSEHNIFLEYQNRASKLDKTGTVDQVKQEIINLLEGGSAAFEKRMEIYGYEDKEINHVTI